MLDVIDVLDAQDVLDMQHKLDVLNVLDVPDMGWMMDVMVATPFFSILHWVFARCARYAGCARCDGCVGCAGYSSRYAGCAARSLIRPSERGFFW